MFQLTSVGYNYGSLLTNTKQESWVGNLLDCSYSCPSSNVGITRYSMHHNHKIPEELSTHESGSDNYWPHVFMGNELAMNEARQMIAYFVYYW